MPSYSRPEPSDGSERHPGTWPFCTLESGRVTGGQQMPEQNEIRVMLVDDHELIRKGLRGYLEQRPGITVVGEAGTVRQATMRAPAMRPDVIVMDVQMPDGTGIEACRTI